MLVNIHKLRTALLLLIIGVMNSPISAEQWTLQQCIDTAQIYNKNLKMSKNNIYIGEQRHKESVAGLIPKVNLNADYKYYTNLPYQLMPASVFGGPAGTFKEAQFGVPHNMSATLQFSMPLYNSQIYGAMKTTKIASELSDLQYKKSEEQMFYEISNLYYNVQILQKQLVFIDSNLINTKRLLNNTKLLKEQLMVKGTDVSKVQLQVSQLMTQKEVLNSKIEQVMNALKFSMGVSISQEIEIEQNIEYKNNKEFASLQTVDIHIAEKQNKLLNSELSSLKNSRLPSLSLYGTYGQTGFGYAVKPNDFLKFFPVGFVGVQFSYPIFNGTVTQRKINQKITEVNNSKLQLSLVQEQNNMLINNAKRMKITAQQTIDNTLEQIKLSESVYLQTMIQQKEGTANLTDVLMADNVLREAQQNNLSAIIEYLKANLELKKLTGNLLDN